MSAEPVINEEAIKGEVRLGMRLDLVPETKIVDGESALGDKEFPSEEESAKLTELIAKRVRKRSPRAPFGSGT